jgi:hypothetical protein
MVVASLGLNAPAFAQTASSATATEIDQNAAIKAFFEEQDAEQLARSPLSKSYRGIKDADYGRWDDNSEAADARAYAATVAALTDPAVDPAAFDAIVIESTSRFSRSGVTCSVRSSTNEKRTEPPRCVVLLARTVANWSKISSGRSAG